MHNIIRQKNKQTKLNVEKEKLTVDVMSFKERDDFSYQHLCSNITLFAISPHFERHFFVTYCRSINVYTCILHWTLRLLTCALHIFALNASICGEIVSLCWNERTYKRINIVHTKMHAMLLNSFTSGNCLHFFPVCYRAWIVATIWATSQFSSIPFTI
jgi:hypothetical protein